jgi:PilZ domain-containing protein
MARRNRKRKSKAASLPTIRSKSEMPAHNPDSPIPSEDITSVSEFSFDSDTIASLVDISSDSEMVATFPDTPSVVENVASPPGTAAATANVAPPSAAPTGADRRTHPRYEFFAAAEVVPTESGARMETRVRDLSLQGCYIDTSDALPLGTVTEVRIIKGAQRFEARARVVYSRPAKGMGLMFASIEPQQFRTLEAWLAESRETSWLAANRRRSQRVLMAVPVRVSGKTGAGAFEEETQTRAISAHGALIHLLTQVYRGQRLTLSNVQTKAALECLVAHIDRRQPNQPQVGVEFLLPNPLFWHVAFPPKDWTPRHPDAKSHTKSRE